jgi:intracellular sulfur oxidation DsrE/DsrF family protein
MDADTRREYTARFTNDDGRRRGQAMSKMTYEEYLDEVTTLITELYEVTDADAIKLVVQAQAAEFFVAHDDNENLRTQERALQDARTLYKQSRKKR